MNGWPFALWGGDGSDDGDTGDGAGDDGDKGKGSDDDDTGSDEPVSMTKKDLEATIAKAVSRATRKDRKSQRESLGFESQDALADFVKAAKEAENTSKSEAEQAAAELEAARLKLSADETSLGQQRIDLTVERAVIMTGITDEATVKRIRTLVRSELGDDFDTDSLAEEVTDALDAVKADIPALFDSQKKSSGSGDGGKGNVKPDTDEEAEKKQLEKYREEYERKYGTITASQ